MPRAIIESLAYGAHGIARVDGKVHFVRQVVPGDEVEIAVREDHGAYAYAEATRLIRAGAARRKPPCPYLPRCGGCPWQQVDYTAQLAAKEAAVRDLLGRVGGLRDVEVRPIVGGREYGYRRRLSLRVEGGRVGYFAAASHALVPVEACLLATAELEGAIPLAQEWVARARTRVKRMEIAARGEADRFVLVAQAEGGFAAADEAASRDLLRRQPRLAGIVLRGRGWRQRWGDDAVRVPLPDIGALELRAESFTQVNDAANQVLVRTVLSAARLRPEDRVVDLYAGAGNLSLPLARAAAEVVAVERNPTSVEDGRRNALRIGIGNLSFIALDAAVALERIEVISPRLDCVVLDPPRGGAAEAMVHLRRLRPARVVYVSCNPATLARDLKSLSDVYAVESVQPIDFFPQTHHVETVSALRRRA